jgi:deoxyribose-phosphate aldolase
LSSPGTDESVATPLDLAPLLECALIRTEFSEDDVVRGCQEARQLGVAAVVVRPSDVDSVARQLQGSPVVLGALVDGPHGYSTTAAKVYAAQDLLRRGVRQIDTVMNTGKLISRQFQFLEMELLQMAESCHQSGAVLAVNLEGEHLNEELNILACRIARRAGVDYIGASRLEDVPLLASNSRDRLKIKCHALALDLDQVLALHAAGCTRIRVSAPASILAAWKAQHAASPQPPAPSH